MEKQEIIQELEKILKDKPWNASLNLKHFIDRLKKEYVPKQRTSQQNRGLHKFCSMLAESLNLAGLEMKVVLKPDYKLWWSMEAVKEHLFKTVMKAKFPKYESTTELKKNGEIDVIHEDLMRMLGEKWGVEYIPFPHDDKKGDNYKLDARLNK